MATKARYAEIRFNDRPIKEMRADPEALVLEPGAQEQIGILVAPACRRIAVHPALRQSKPVGAGQDCRVAGIFTSCL
ncbi:hypothetical protein, partial [Sphingobium sp.]|uniref:hypothetical protein n=1 Tax=Sphingobium sp. TaxID=1912891 RepID=UPI002BF38CF6